MNRLAIEIGGTKLQLAIGREEGPPLVVVERRDINPEAGAAGILEQIEQVARPLLESHEIGSIGIGFGGPVDSATGVVTKSHQVQGWEHFPLAAWCRDKFSLPTVVRNDCDTAALAEATWGAGRDYQRVFYVTVGSGIGGGLVIDGKLQGEGRPAIAEIGHLRPGLLARLPDVTVEAIASGWGIASMARKWISGGASNDLARLGLTSPRFAYEEASKIAADLDALKTIAGDPAKITARHVAQLAGDGNLIASHTLDLATQALGWAIAQTITLTAPHCIILGGGVSQMPEDLFLNRLRQQTAQYIFPPLAESYQILPATLGEEVVLHGAVALPLSEAAN
ncbi:MAG: ROK family protein [Pirellulaceae bacterium]